MATSLPRAVESINFDFIEERSVPLSEQVTLRVSKERREHMKLISRLSQPHRTVFQLTDSVLTAFIRRFEIASQMRFLDSPLTVQATDALPAPDASEIEDYVIPADDQTGLKVAKDVREALRRISLVSGKTIFAITDASLEKFATQFDAASRYALISRFRS
ncbi:hypothetical protein DIE11_17315 [Burkholderia sp. Bp9012]|uniref:hypothetical protein n=1 Tax=Burkholderia sp. Bp9012 TaxID=2184562 RepID=UPI000F5B43D0|nr:hypothetical protein [Burkholderia sp. Bp9012]RQR79157.1 hypothetical protein DIE11_17315 [Burkholderia sp. Bp9012]